MKVLILLLTTQVVLSQFVQNPSTPELKSKIDQKAQHLMNLQEFLQNKIKTARSSFKTTNSYKKINPEELSTTKRKSKNFPFFPFFPLPALPFPVSPSGFLYPQDKEIVENSYPTEWLSRTEPFRKNPPLLDSPTYYIRLPPNPYIYIPGIGYVSRPPTLSDPELVENNKPEQSNDITNEVENTFYKVPIKFISNGKPTSVYQLANGQSISKPESSLVNLDKGPYVFNGKPNEIYLIAQIYDALYGDELPHFYP